MSGADGARLWPLIGGGALQLEQLLAELSCPQFAQAGSSFRIDSAIYPESVAPLVLFTPTRTLVTLDLTLTLALTRPETLSLVKKGNT
jgi:hypothetical protein